MAMTIMASRGLCRVIGGCQQVKVKDRADPQVRAHPRTGQNQEKHGIAEKGEEVEGRILRIGSGRAQSGKRQEHEPGDFESPAGIGKPREPDADGCEGEQQPHPRQNLTPMRDLSKQFNAHSSPGRRGPAAYRLYR